MGSFASLLGGLATGARDEYSKIDTAKQADKRAKDKSIADAVLKDLQTNDQLTPEEQENHFRTFLDLNGVKDKKVVDGLISHSQYHRQVMAENARKAGYGQQQPQLGGGDQSSAGGTTPGVDGAPDVALPPMPMAPTGGIPQLPAAPYAPKTSGQLAYEESRPRVQQGETDKANAQRQAIRDQNADQINDKLTKLKDIDNDNTLSEDEKDRAYSIVGVKRTSGGGAVKPLSAPIYGHELKQMLGQDNLNGEPIHDDTRYTGFINSAGKVVGGHLYTEPTTGKVTIPDPNSPTGWSLLQVDRTGQELGRTLGVPADPRYAEVVRNGQHQVWVDFGDHKELKSVGTSSTTQRLPGGPAQTSVAPPVPPAPNSGTPPVAPPPAGANGRPTPGQPIPRPNAGGAGGTIASEPKGLPVKTKMDTIVGVNATDHAILPMQRMLDNLDVLSNPAIAAAIHFQADPNTGNITSYISGHALDGNPKAQQFAADVIAATEDINKIRGAFGATAFRGHDAFQAMIAQAGAGRLLVNPNVLKATLTKSIWDLQAMRDEQAGFVGMSPKYNSTPSTPLPAPPALGQGGGGTPPAGKIAVIRKSDGKKGFMSPESFDPKKYDKQ
jgi:hypothetical protein